MRKCFSVNPSNNKVSWNSWNWFQPPWMHPSFSLNSQDSKPISKNKVIWLGCKNNSENQIAGWPVNHILFLNNYFLYKWSWRESVGKWRVWFNQLWVLQFDYHCRECTKLMFRTLALCQSNTLATRGLINSRLNSLIIAIGKVQSWCFEYRPFVRTIH